MTLPWNEKITMLSIHPDAASRDDVARLASELMVSNRRIETLNNQIYQLEEILECKDCSAKTDLPQNLIGCKANKRIEELEDMLQNLANEMMEDYEKWDIPEKGALLGWHQRIDKYLKGDET